MIFQLLALDPSILPPSLGHLSYMGTAANFSVFASHLGDKDKGSKFESILDVVLASDDFTFSPAFTNSIIKSWNTVSKREDPEELGILGSSQLITWLNGYSKKGIYGSNIENAKESVGIYKDAAALAPLNLTPYRLWDIMHGYGLTHEQRTLFYAANHGVQNGALSKITVNGDTVGDLSGFALQAFALQVGALVSTGGVIATQNDWLVKWNTYDRKAVITPFPEGSFIRGYHETLGSWVISVASVPLSNADMLTGGFVGSLVSGVLQDSGNFILNKAGDVADTFKHTWESVISSDSESGVAKHD